MTMPNPPGHQVVAPGQTVASDWGNAVWNQSIQRFSNAAGRTAQFAAPEDGNPAWLEDPGQLDLWRAGGWRAVPTANRHHVEAFYANPSILAGTGSQAVVNMSGWNGPPVVTITVAVEFFWAVRLGAVTATQLNIFAVNGVDGSALPDGATIPLHLIMAGELLPGSAGPVLLDGVELDHPPTQEDANVEPDGSGGYRMAAR